MEVGRGGACVPARVALQGRIHRQRVCIMRNAQTFQRMETPLLRMGDVPFADGNASFVDRDVPFTDGNASFTDGDVPFVDGNAAARTFGRAHRRRPYHFSCGSVS